MYNGKFGIWLFLASEIMLFGALFSTYVLLRVGAPEGTWPIAGSPTTRGDNILQVPLAALNTAFLITSSVTMVLAWANLKMGSFKKGQQFLLVTVLLAGAFLVVKYFEYNSKLHHYAVTFNEHFDRDGVESKSFKGLTQAGTEKTIHYLWGHVEETKKDADGAIQSYLFMPDHDTSHGGEGHEPKAVEIHPAEIARMTTFGPGGSSFLGCYFVITGLHGLHIVGGIVVMLWFLLTGSKMWKTQPDKYANRIECTGLYWHFVDLVWIFLFPVLYLL
ncbi:MAG: heme-copper oxidase subunit III [Phycisphaerales bacterium]|nr:heme-copper oxidase subunit III [Phycisphaerales bacterium]MCB9854268.1 heme-copper oxidase subunit III [Phycisphaerales bacterium]